jgi:hypothetical protein
VAQTTNHRPLTTEEINRLEQQGCSCADWSNIRVAEDFRPARVRGTHFAGQVRLGASGGTITSGESVEKICGVFNAYLDNCEIGDDVRIANVGVHIANYNVGDGACIENVGSIETRPGATFGNGVEIEPLNEGGGREVVLFNRLDSQFAHLLCLHRFRPRLTERLEAMVEAETAKVRSDRGTIGSGARVCNVRKMVDVNVGDRAVIDGATSLINGTVLSDGAAPTTVGSDVQAEDFIIAEGTKVTGGAILSKTFVGQGCQIGRQFSSEGSVFFANCEGFHGEACSVFAGPYTVTHHKSTLLIAGLFSFYNAGSGTNQSNHLYKLGPVHEGKLERGCKTGSFSYMMWPCRVGPFSVVLGKHMRTFDTADFPFSYLEATSEGRCLLTPGFNLTTVGTVRDGVKWPARDRRQGTVKRDRITFDVFSPLTVGRMMGGVERLKALYEKADRAMEIVTTGGVDMKRVLLKTGQKFYRAAIEMYLLEKVLARAEQAIAAGNARLTDAMAAAPDAVFSEPWVDIGGQMMPRSRLDDLTAAVEEGRIADLDGLSAELDRIQAAYAEDEWAWVRWAYTEVFDKELDNATGDDLVQVAEQLVKTRSKYLKMVLHDAGKEFGVAVQTGFGQGGDGEDVAADFASVRGHYETNKFVQQLEGDIAALADRSERFQQAVTGL